MSTAFTDFATAPRIGHDHGQELVNAVFAEARILRQQRDRASLEAATLRRQRDEALFVLNCVKGYMELTAQPPVEPLYSAVLKALAEEKLGG